jgi:hypothetical protein
MTLTAPPQREQISTSMLPKATTVGKHSQQQAQQQGQALLKIFVEFMIQDLISDFLENKE